MNDRPAGAPTELESEVFVCGCEHSGTSLLANMFAAHHQVYVPLVETYVFQEGRDVARGLGELRREAIAANRRFLIEKTPPHISRIPAMRQFAPRARIVIPVRDGRDVVASLVRKKGPQKAASSARRWIRANTIAAAERSAPDVLVYRHEDLVRNPKRTLEQICTFAGIPFDAAMLDYHRQERLWFHQSEVRQGTGLGRDEHQALRNWQVNQPIFDSSGRWRTELSKQELAPLMTGSGRQLMESFGYLPAAESSKRGVIRRFRTGLKPTAALRRRDAE